MLLLFGGVLSNINLVVQSVLVHLLGVLEFLVKFVLQMFGGFLSLDGLFLSDFLDLGNVLPEFLALALTGGSSLFISGGKYLFEFGLEMFHLLLLEVLLVLPSVEASLLDLWRNCLAE